MKWLRTLTVLAMVAFWLPATNHCRLEQIPWLAFLTCCDHDESVPHQDNDCDTDNCAAVEEGLYKTEDCQITVTVPVFAELLFAPVVLDASPTDGGVLRAPRETPDSIIPASWQFSLRTALPPRAPSFAS